MESSDNTFNVTYYDGLSSRGRDAVLSFNAFEWVIRFQNNDGVFVTRRWEVTQIKRNETASGVNTFRYASEPPEVIESRDPRVLQALKEVYPRQSFVDKKYSWLFSTGVGGIVTVTVVLLGLLAAAYFLLLPAAAVLLANTVPQAYEVKLGEQLYDGFVSTYEVNDSLTKHVNDYAAQVDFDTDYPIQITVVNRDEVNAFALPGGRVVVFSKLLDNMKRHEELAALLGHEVAHVKERHSLKALARNLSGYVFIGLLFGDLNAVAAVIVDNADMLNRMSYSRSLERQADEDAVATLNRNGIDIDGMVSLFETLESENKLELAEFISTHPLTEARIQYAKEQAQRQLHTATNGALESAWKKIVAVD